MRFARIAFGLLLMLSLVGCAGSSSAPANSPTSSSSSASLKNSYGITNATADTVFGRPDRIAYRGGSIGVFSASSDDCTIENITIWYNQYVKHGLDDWDVIVYTDRPGFGVYAGAGMIEVNTELDSNYMTAGSDDAELYVFKEGASLQDGELVSVG